MELSEFSKMCERIYTGSGIITALDQSGGSTPTALNAYGIKDEEISSDEVMFAMMHAMRRRVMQSPAFNSNKILGAILFEDTLHRNVGNVPTPEYLWKRKQIVPFLKVDKGLLPADNGVQLMKPMPTLETLLEKASLYSIFGTKMRSVIHEPNQKGIDEIVTQQFEIASRIVEFGFTPIIEPEVSIHCNEKIKAEQMLKTALLERLNALPDGIKVMLKLTLPSQANFYSELTLHPNVVKVLALSGGYSLEEAIGLLAQNTRVIASFSRALLNGLNVKQTDEEFDNHLMNKISAIYLASR